MVHVSVVFCFVPYRTLQHFNTASDEYSVIFVSNCTAALKLVAESFCFIETLPESCQDGDNGDNDDHTIRNCSADMHCITNSTLNFDCVYEQNTAGDPEEFPTKCQHSEEVLHHVQVEDCHNLCDGAKPVSTAKSVTCINSTDYITTATVNVAAAAADDDDNRGCDKSVSSCEWNCEPLLKPTFLYLVDNHTSVVGMRCVISNREAQFCCIDADDVDTFLFSLRHCAETKPSQSVTVICPTSPHPSITYNSLTHDQPCHYVVNSLFAYPAQSNFSGRRYPLEWANAVHCGSDVLNTLSGMQRKHRTCPHWYVLLDAAALLTTSTLDLSLYKPDFVVLSFYKMFGFPTGLGMSSCYVDLVPSNIVLLTGFQSCRLYDKKSFVMFGHYNC